MNVLIVKNDANPKALETSFTLSAWLDSQGINNLCLDSSSLYGCTSPEENKHLLGDIPEDGYGLAVVLGGDGTMLRTARLLAGLSTPILGINFGHMGFLANGSEEGVIQLVSRAFADELLSEKRAGLLIDIETLAQDGSIDAFKKDIFAMNEIAITRGEFGRLLTFSIGISDAHIATLGGDGVVVASATGSTAYALAAGGPLVTPTFTGMVVQPIAPHTLSSRAILSDPSDVVHISIETNTDDVPPALFVDGDFLELPGRATDIYVRRYPDAVRFLYSDRDHFYKYASEMFFKS